jgi:phosphotransferase system  glucose/maltose/N-acetylglucosamine-specific IIC component
MYIPSNFTSSTCKLVSTFCLSMIFLFLLIESLFETTWFLYVIFLVILVAMIYVIFYFMFFQFTMVEMEERQRVVDKEIKY